MIATTNHIKDNPKSMINKIHIVINVGIIISLLFWITINSIFGNTMKFDYMSISGLLSFLGLGLGALLLKLNFKNETLDNLLIFITMSALIVTSFAYFATLDLVDSHMQGFMIITLLSHIVVFLGFMLKNILKFNWFRNLGSELQGYLIGGGGTLIVFIVSNYYSNKYYNESFIPILVGFIYLIALGYSAFLAAKLFLIKKEN